MFHIYFKSQNNIILKIFFNLERYDKISNLNILYVVDRTYVLRGLEFETEKFKNQETLLSD